VAVQLIEAIIAGVIQFALEVVGAAIFSSPVSLFAPPGPSRLTDRVALTIGLLIFGGACGWVSIVLFPSRALTVAWVRILVLLVAPFVAGVLAWLIAKRRVREDPLLEPRAYFWYAFAFAFTYAAYRFAYAQPIMA
jgi:hypothetical protein